MTTSPKKKAEGALNNSERRKSTSPMKANFHGSADDAKKYMQETGMEVFINQLVNRGFVYRATNAYTFMLKELSNDLDEAELAEKFGIQRTGAEKVRLAKEKGGSDASSEQSPDRESEAPSSWAFASQAQADYPMRSGTPDPEAYSFSAKVVEGSPEKRALKEERAAAAARRKRLDERGEQRESLNAALATFWKDPLQL